MPYNFCTPASQKFRWQDFFPLTNFWFRVPRPGFHRISLQFCLGKLITRQTVKDIIFLYGTLQGFLHHQHSKQKGTLRHAVPCEHKSATVDGIKLSMTKLRGYIVIAPLCLLENGTDHHVVCQALFLKNCFTIIIVIIAKICPSRKEVICQQCEIIFKGDFQRVDCGTAHPAFRTEYPK